MNAKLIQSQRRLRDNLYELYEQGGLELYLAGTRGLQRDLIIELETSALTPERLRCWRIFSRFWMVDRAELTSVFWGVVSSQM